ncbi:MAG: hypothetical protein AMXMBFR58_27730 [Phycisphaerae bacterium]
MVVSRLGIRVIDGTVELAARVHTRAVARSHTRELKPAARPVLAPNQERRGHSLPQPEGHEAKNGDQSLDERLVH